MLKVRIGTFTATATSLRGVRLNTRAKRTAVLEAAGGVLFKAVKSNIGLRDHTLAELAALDHPYAKRHGRIRIHNEKPYMVHRQDGDLDRSLKGEVNRSAKNYRVSFDTGIAPHADYVVGAKPSAMIARDVLWLTAHEPTVTRGMMKAVIVQLGQVMRAQAIVRFGS